MIKLTRLNRLLFVILVVAVCVVIDQVTKVIARATLYGAPPISLLGGLVRLEYTENSGALLSLGATLPAPVRFGLFVVFVTAVVVASIVVALRSSQVNWAQLAGLSLLAAGGLGNLVDRLTNNGLVVDFMVLGIGPLHTGIFNVADMAVMAGLASLLWSMRELGKTHAVPSSPRSDEG